MPDASYWEPDIAGIGREEGTTTLGLGRASVQAQTECEVLVIDRDAFGQIIQSNVALAETISGVLSKRDEALERSDEDANATPQSQQHTQTLLFGKIRRFFSLRP